MPEPFLHLKAQEQSQIYRALAPQLARSPGSGKGCLGLLGAANPVHHARSAAHGIQGWDLTVQGVRRYCPFF